MRPLHAVFTFVEEILEINEADYGDFMRRANMHLHELRDALHGVQDERVADKIDEMKLYVQYAPSWDIESTRDRILDDSKLLIEWLGPQPKPFTEIRAEIT